MVSTKINNYKITIVGSGYVGMSLGVLLAKNNLVTIVDIDEERIDKINSKESTIIDVDIKKYLETKELNLKATSDDKSSYIESDFIIISTPTDYDPETNMFDTSTVDSVIANILKVNQKCMIVVKSTIPVGYIDKKRKEYNTDRIIFSPEFLREGKALYDNLYPSRIIIGGSKNQGMIFAQLLAESALKKNIQILYVEPKEAESIKLFANSYLAMRVAFFNELDSFSITHNLDTKNIINGICLDERIGNYYNNPSFGYGGYCLPKDTKQLLANFNEVPQTLMKAIVSSNDKRKEFIAQEVLSKNPKIVGIYLLEMKKGSENHRSSSIKSVMQRILKTNTKVILYEPGIKTKTYLGSKVINDFNKFKKMADIIVANRIDKRLHSEANKVFTRDIFKSD